MGVPQEIAFEQLKSLKEPCVVIIRSGRIGDIVACEPVIPYARKTYPGHKTAWIVRKCFKSTLTAHPQLDFIVDYENVKIRYLLEFLRANQSVFPMINLNPFATYCFMSRQGLTSKSNPDSMGYRHHKFGSLLESFSRAAGVSPLTGAPSFFIDSKIVVPKVPSPYITIHCCSSKAGQECTWPTDKWNRLVDYFISKKIHVVEIGNDPVLKRQSPYYLSLAGRDTLQASAKLIKGSAFFIGIDSGFAHIANALQVDGLVIMGQLGQFFERVTFTGLYRDSNHKVLPRQANAPAAEVAVEDVIARCEERLPWLNTILATSASTPIPPPEVMQASTAGSARVAPASTIAQTPTAVPVSAVAQEAVMPIHRRWKRFWKKSLRWLKQGSAIAPPAPAEVVQIKQSEPPPAISSEEMEKRIEKIVAVRMAALEKKLLGEMVPRLHDLAEFVDGALLNQVSDSPSYLESLLFASAWPDAAASSAAPPMQALARLVSSLFYHIQAPAEAVAEWGRIFAKQPRVWDFFHYKTWLAHMTALLEIGDRESAKDIFCQYDHLYRLKNMAAFLPMANFADELGAGWLDIEDAAFVYRALSDPGRPTLESLVRGKRLALIGPDGKKMNPEADDGVADLVIRCDDFLPAPEKGQNGQPVNVWCCPPGADDSHLDMEAVKVILLTQNIRRTPLERPEQSVQKLKGYIESGKTVISVETEQMRDFIATRRLFRPTSAQVLEHLLEAHMTVYPAK